jgi:hypothetical protein
MKWQIKKIDANETDKLQVLMNKGWEPFAVTTFNATQHLQYEYIWLRKRSADVASHR